MIAVDDRKPILEAAATGSEPGVEADRATLGQVARLFLRLGATAFGGPAAHVGIMENEVVRRRVWLTHQRFLDLLGAANLIPGPSSTELAIFIGYEHAGWRGLVLAGSCFILPAALMVTLLAWVYVRFGSLPQLGGVLYGIKAVVIPIVVQALLGLAPRAVKSSMLLVIVGLLAGVASALGVNPLLVLVGAGTASLVARQVARTDGMGAGLAPLAVSALSSGAALGMAPVSLFKLFVTFVKIGTVVFGSGYVLLPFLRADFVDRLHWLTESQLLDAVAIGQVTPGPLFTTATFIGYVVGGWWGAVVGTIGIFVPGFFIVAAIRPLLARVRRSPIAGAFLDGLNVGAVALIAVVAVQLAKVALVDLPAGILAAVAGVLLLRLELSSVWLVLGGAVVGLLVRAVL